MNTLTDVTLTLVVVLAFIDRHREHNRKLTVYKHPAEIVPSASRGV